MVDLQARRLGDWARAGMGGWRMKVKEVRVGNRSMADRGDSKLYRGSVVELLC